MKKTGPCYHCGVTSTPLWRNGPPDKPILCNACGSRWRTKGSLKNYAPSHVREAFGLEELKVAKVHSFSFKSKEHKLHKQKWSSTLDSEHELRNCDQNYQKMVEGDSANRSSCGNASSAISYSESCVHFGTIDPSDMTGSVHSNAWDPLIPSGKRTFGTPPKPSPVEMLTTELYSIWHEQQSCNLSGYSEDDLLYESVPPLGSLEIGYGSVLIRHPCSKSVEEESEATSLPLERKVYTECEANVGSASFPVNNKNTRAVFSNIDRGKLNKSAEKFVEDDAKRVPHEKHRLLRDKDLPLVTANLIDVVNFEAFMKFLSLEEQQKLMKYLPSIDTSRPPESIKDMFRSHHFLETITCFQHLLQEGVFDLSFTSENEEECRNIRSYILSGLRRSEWFVYHKSLKKTKANEMIGVPNSVEVPKLVTIKRSCGSQTQINSEMKGATRSPKRLCTSEEASKAIIGTDGPIYNGADIKISNDIDNSVEEETFSSPKSSFVALHDGSSMWSPLPFTSDSSDQDLTVDMPSCASFAEAELYTLC